MKLVLIFFLTWTNIQGDVLSIKHGYPEVGHLGIIKPGKGNKLTNMHNSTLIYNGFPLLGYPKVEVPSTRASTVIKQFPLLIDHWAWFYKQRFNMRYAENREFFNGSGPMFVMIGGRNRIEDLTQYLTSGMMYELARDLGAYMFVTEHRFYGESVPNLDLTTYNLRFLTPKQALEDVATFISTMQRTTDGLSSSNQVVVFGGSYGGTLATWMRYKYPSLVTAAVASSAPLEATEDYFQYLEMVQRSIQTAMNGSTSCTDVIKNTITEIQVKLHSDAGVAQLQTDFVLCEPLNAYDTTEVTQFFANIIYYIAQVVQYGTTDSIAAFCSSILANASAVDDYTRLANYYSTLNKKLETCMPSYQTTIGRLQDTGIKPAYGRTWFYQMCSQFGFYATTNSNDQPFSNTVPTSYFTKLCEDVFGIFFNSMRTSMGISNTNNLYKGLNIQVTQVATTQGSLDPWSVLGLTQDITPLAPAIIINGTSHCGDLGPSSASDSNSLSIARTRVKTLIYEWLGIPT